MPLERRHPVKNELVNSLRDPTLDAKITESDHVFMAENPSDLLSVVLRGDSTFERRHRGFGSIQIDHDVVADDMDFW